MSFSSLIQHISEGKFEFVFQNYENTIESLSNKQAEQLLSSFSHFLYNNNAISTDQLSFLAKLTFKCITTVFQNQIETRVAEILKAVNYILVNGVKKGLDIEWAIKLVEEVETFLSSIQNSLLLSLSEAGVLKRFHSAIWNISLDKKLLPFQSLQLQGQALVFFCLAENSLSDVCKNCQKICILAEQKSCSPKNIEEAYNKVLSAIIRSLKQKPTIIPSSVVALNLLTMDYAKILYRNKTISEFSKVFRPLASLLEPLCDPKVILSFKMSVKIVEVGIALALDQCKHDQLIKILTGCKVISLSSLCANTILVDALLFTHQIVGNKEASVAIPMASRTDSMDCIFSSLLARISSHSSVAPESLVRLLEAISNHITCYVEHITAEPSDSLKLLSKAVESNPGIKSLLDHVQNCKGEVQIYNIGIHCCNIGVIAFKTNNYSIAADFLDTGIEYLLYNYNLQESSQKQNALSILSKKSSLLRDCLRYSGKFKETMMKTLSLVAQKIIPASDIITTWIKCKRDSHKANKNDLKKLCIKDIYSECIGCGLNVTSLEESIHDVVAEELKNLGTLNYSTEEDEICCAKALIKSGDITFGLEGNLALAKVLWQHPHLQEREGSPLDALNYALCQLEASSVQGDCSSEFVYEYKGRIHFWLYLGNLQVILKKAEIELDEKEKSSEPLTAQSTDMGEEAQPNDACSVRPSTSVSTFSTQEDTLFHLHQSLHFWDLAVKSCSILSPSKACNELISIGYTYKLSGLLPSCIKAFTLSLAIANKHNLNQFWIQAVTELMEIVPELISSKVAERVLFLLNAETGVDPKFGASPKMTDYARYTTLAALAYYHYRTGEYKTGAPLILECLSSPLMEKRTPASTEMQIMVYFVASHYAFLPNTLLPDAQKPQEPCLFLSLAATRKAIGLINTQFEFGHHESVCHRHKMAWLHHVTNLWLGRLCYYTAQPRVARAYLRQALTIAEKLALPLRTLELLSLLAEIDLQCDQFDDCRVKIDSLHQLLKVHTSIEPQDATKTNHLLTYKSKKTKKPPCGISTNRKWESDTVQICADGNNSLSESLRESNLSPEFTLKPPDIELGNQLLVIGEEKRIRQLALDGQSVHNQCPGSPSIGFREEAVVVRGVICPTGVAECSVCVSPQLHTVAVNAKTLMGVIHARRKNPKGSQICFEQAESDLLSVLNLSEKVTSKLCSILSLGSTHELELANEKELALDFIPSQTIMAKLNMMFCRNEMLCMDSKNWSQMESRVTSTLSQVSDLSSIILTTNHPFVLRLILQSKAIMRTLEKKQIENKNTVVVEDLREETDTTETLNTLTSEFKTPARSSYKSRIRKEALFPHLKSPATPFRIFADGGDPSSYEIPATGCKPPTRKEKEVKNLADSFGLLALSGAPGRATFAKSSKTTVSSTRNTSVRVSSTRSSKPANVASTGSSKPASVSSARSSNSISTPTVIPKSSTSPRFSPLSNLNSSPFSQVLHLPSQQISKNASLASQKDLNTRTRKGTSSSKLKGLATKIATEDTEAVKENSPLIKMKLKPNEHRTKPARTAGVNSVATKTYSAKSAKTKSDVADNNDAATTRLTRSRRNLKRL